MSVKAFSRANIFRQTTSSPWTKHFRHLEPIPRHWTKRTSWRDPHLKPVKPSDRIKFWNIVPGDRICLLGDKHKIIREVLAINRLTNRVYLKGSRNTGEQAPEGKTPPAWHVPYAQCQLFVGYRDFPATKGEKPFENRPVFATRVNTSRARYSLHLHRYVWERFAAQTTPRIPQEELKDSRVRIAWPTPDLPIIPGATAYDTPAETVAAVTYHPPVFPKIPRKSLDPPATVPSTPMEYIRALRGEASAATDQLLAELQLERELSNPHSRAKKQARWQAKQEYEAALLKRYVSRALAVARRRAAGTYADDKAKGKIRREARAEAVFRWKQRLEEERRAEKFRRWVNRGMQDRLFVKQQRKVRKEERRQRALENLVLADAPNQVVPI